jgi:hypothetical protein
MRFSLTLHSSAIVFFTVCSSAADCGDTVELAGENVVLATGEQGDEVEIAEGERLGEPSVQWVGHV